ncbi:MAG: hypothetical protein IKB75_04310 [Clostridia bacterium]|nr:hypothetical protein [Clostridia bacterium]
MTNAKLMGRKRLLSHFSAGDLLFLFFSIFCLCLILRNSELAISSIHRGLLLCARTVIPSLFPFMVLSEWMINGGIERFFPKKLLLLGEKLLGFSPSAFCAILLGAVCGFPVGAKCLCLAYRKGGIGKRELERGLALSSNPSSAFLISAVGVSLWGSRRFGTVLYATVLASSLLYGLVAWRFQRKREPKRTFTTSPDVPPQNVRGVRLFTDSVFSATASMLSVCAYILFFSALMGCLGMLVTHLGASAAVGTGLFCIFELSGGISAAAGLQDPMLAAWLTAFAAGWSGISVHCQILSVCDSVCKKEALSYRAYLFGKLAQGLLCSLLFGLIFWLFPQILLPDGSQNTGIPW